MAKDEEGESVERERDHAMHVFRKLVFAWHWQVRTSRVERRSQRGARSVVRLVCMHLCTERTALDGLKGTGSVRKQGGRSRNKSDGWRWIVFCFVRCPLEKKM